ncbi:MAG: DinB family protein [Ginsengibacter sp.]
MHTEIYRRGAVGALLDLYEHAIAGLIKVIEDIPDHALSIITDAQTTDENCTSLQAILSHVVYSGYGYATSIHNVKGNYITRPSKAFHITTKEYSEDLANVFAYTQTVFKDIGDGELEQVDNSLKIQTGWGQCYDVEQMMEHGIVHVLRHKRQIERIKSNGS